LLVLDKFHWICSEAGSVQSRHWKSEPFRTINTGAVQCPIRLFILKLLARIRKLLEEFYKSVFGWATDPIIEGYSLVETGMGIKGEQKAYGPLPIPDGGFFAGFTDPEGHLIGVLQGPAGI
jgi:hypothetical protein